MDYRVAQNVVSHVYRTEKREDSNALWEPTGNEFLRFNDAEDAVNSAIAFASARNARWVPVTKETVYGYITEKSPVS